METHVRKREMNERVSVVIPCYKQGHLLTRALKSLEKQGHPDLEVIVVDDGSPEPVILPDVNFPFPVQLVRIANRGLSGARNVGLGYVTGNYIKFLDADDALLPDCIALQYASMGGRTDSISIIGFMEVNENTNKQAPIISAFGDFREALLQINIGPPHIYLYPTKAVLEIGGFHEGERVQGGHEDYDLVMRLSAAGYHAISVHKLGAIYYRRMDTMSTAKEAMDRTRVAVWAKFAGSVVRSGQCSQKLLLAALAGWIRHTDITPTHLAGPLEEAASELAEMLEEAGSLLPQTEVDILRTRLLCHDSVGAKRLINALPRIFENNCPLFSSPQEVIDRRLGFVSPTDKKGKYIFHWQRHTRPMTDKFQDAMWQRDIRLCPIKPLLPHIRILSLDIFDTLLFRACRKPDDVFEAVGKKAAADHMLHSSYTPEDFRAIRTYALDTAYRKSSVEPNLEDILACLPPMVCDIGRLLDLEVEKEIEYCYLNPSMVSLIKECRQLGITIVLLSDMYLGSDRIKHILEQNGLPLEWVDRLMVSIDEGSMKSTGGLFQNLLDQYPEVKPAQILHVGDNLDREIVPANRLGIHTCHYDVIAGDTTNVLNYEMLAYNEVLPKLFSLRSLAMSLNADVMPSEQRWHQVGSGVLGPFLSAFCEWIVDMAVKEKVDVIAPFMREAVLLAPMLERVVKQRNLVIPVHSLYVSRQAVVLAGKEIFDAGLLDSMARTRQYFRISELFSTLGFDAVPEAFLPYSDTYLENAKGVYLNAGNSLYEALESYLLRDSNKEQIETAFQKKRHALLNYINGVVGEYERVISVDIGFFGQIQEGLESAFQLENRKKTWIHLMGFGRERLVSLLGKGMQCRVFAGGMGCNRKYVAEIHRSAPIIEQLFMMEEGSTLGYARSSEGRCIPVLEDNPIDAQEIEKKRIVHAGIHRFQNLWFLFAEMKPDFVKSLVSDRSGWVRLIHRLIRMPTPEEAWLIGDLHNDTNYGSTRTVRMCPEDEVVEAQRLGPNTYRKALRYSAAVWPHGILTRVAPADIVALRAIETYGVFFEVMLALAQSIREDGFTKVIAVGANGAVIDFIRAARMSDIHIVCVADESNGFCVGRIEGVDIVSMAQAVETGHHCFAVASPTVAQETREKILCRYKESGHTPTIYVPSIAWQGDGIEVTTS